MNRMRLVVFLTCCGGLVSTDGRAEPPVSPAEALAVPPGVPGPGVPADVPAGHIEQPGLPLLEGAPETTKRAAAPGDSEVGAADEVIDPWAGPDVARWLASQGLDTPETLHPARFNVGGFADVNFHGSNLDGHAHGGFHIGQLVFHGIADLTRGFGAFMEVSVNSEPSWETRVERLLLFWELNDAFKLSFGRHHIPVTWWNSTFHHGLWLQTTARRPIIIGYNDAFIPNHAVGLLAEGRLPVLEALGARYQLGVTGGGDDHQHSGERRDDEHAGLRLAWTASLFFEPPAVQRLRVGAVAFGDPTRRRQGRRVDELTFGGHVAYTAEQPEVIAEVINVRHKAFALEDGSGAGDFSHWAWYVQLAFRLPGAASSFKPYARYERLILDRNQDLTLDNSESVEVVLGGVRWDLSSWFSLKFEGSWRSRSDSLDLVDGLVQASAAW